MHPRILWELVADTLGFEKHSWKTQTYMDLFSRGTGGGSCSLTPSTIYWEG